jgi:hypothetical protein
MARGTLSFKDHFVCAAMSRVGKRWIALNRTGDELILSNLARLAGLIPISNIGINFEPKGISGV